MPKYKLVIVMRTDLDMGKGKMCVQAGHASILAYIILPTGKVDDYHIRNEWVEEGQFKVVLKCPIQETHDGAYELQIWAETARRAGLPVVEVRDFGKTQVEPNTLTCIGIGPALSEEVDKVTGDLPLL